MVQHKDRVPSYGIITRCLHDLTRKGTAWRWRDDVEDAAFERLRTECSKNRILAAFDLHKQVFVASDASEHGKGAVVYQLKDPSKPHSLDNEAILLYYSKAWGASMLGKPPYYLEADGLVTAITIAKYYSEATPFPLIAECDQAPLKWIKTASKGVVTAWRIENLNGVDYEVRYWPGVSNTTADALSRPPMLGPRKFARTGVESALRALLTSLPASARDAKKIWFWAGSDTRALSMIVQEWRSGGGARRVPEPKAASSLSNGGVQ
jgi:hypothetical protein